MTGFRRQAASAVMHPVTLGALGVLLANDLVFKALWPGAWIPGKLSDLAWMVFAPPVLAYALSFGTRERPMAERAAFAAAYAGLPLLYAAFNTFEPVHDAILRALGIFGGDGPRSPLDSTDSLVIPFAMVAALWVWRRPPLETASIRTRLAILAAIAAALASVATSYEADRGITEVGRTDSGALGAHVSSYLEDSGTYYSDRGTYESIDGGYTWSKVSKDYLALSAQTQNPLGEYYTVVGPHVMLLDAASGSQEVAYSFEYLRGGGNRWMQSLDKSDISNAVVSTSPYQLFYDDQSGNLIVAMGLQGVVVVAPDGTSARIAVGAYSPTDFSFRSKTLTLLDSLKHAITLSNIRALWQTWVALLLAFSFATLAVAAYPASAGPRTCFAFAAAILAFVAVTLGVYPYEFENPWGSNDGRYQAGGFAFLVSGVGLVPLLLVVGGLLAARPGRGQLLGIFAAAIGMLALIALGVLVLFETGPVIANVVAVAMVALAALVLWAFQWHRRKRSVKQ